MSGFIFCDYGLLFLPPPEAEKPRQEKKGNCFIARTAEQSAYLKKQQKRGGRGSVGKPLLSDRSLTTLGHQLLANGACLFCLLEFKRERERKREILLLT